MVIILLYTSAEANKLLHKLNEEKLNIESLEHQSCVFHCAMGEKPDEVRPDYDYCATQEKLVELERKIRKIKHAINLFNISTLVQEFNMTVDELLVYIPQLTAHKQKLYNLQARLPKSRDNSYRGNSSIIDYCMVNYDITRAREDYSAVSDELSKAQISLDLLNNSIKFEIEL